MAKIPFDIKYRPEIEAGKYEVVTRLDTPVKILCYDARGKYPIAGLVRGDESDCAQTWRIDGTFDGRNESSYDLFLITPEPELTEFEKVLLEIVHRKPEEATERELRGMRIYRDRLLSLARKELQPEKDNLIKKVKALRDAQNMHAKTLNYGWLQKAKRLEKEVDEILKKLLI